MGKKYILLGYLVGLLMGVSAQTPTIDSLKKELTVHTRNDSTRVNILNDLAFEFYRIDLDITQSYLEKSEEALTRLNYPKGKARALYIRGVVEYFQSNYDQATAYIRNAIQVYDTTKHKKGYAKCFNILGLIAMDKGDYRESIALFKKSMEIDAGIEGSKGNPSVLLNLGNVYADLGGFSESIAHYQQALDIYSELNNQRGITQCLNNLGKVSSEQGNEPKALEYFYEAKYHYEKANDSLGISLALNNLGSSYKGQGDYEKALKFYRESLAIHKRSNNKKHIVRTSNNIGNLYKGQKAYPMALQFYQEALELGQEIGDLDNVASSLSSIGDVHFELREIGLARDYYERAEAISLKIDDQHALPKAYLGIAETYVVEGDYPQALIYTQKSEKISNETNVLVQQSDVQSLFFRIYKATGKYGKALQSHESYKALEDSLLNKENIQKMAQLEYEYKYKAELESANIREKKLSKTVQSTTRDLEQSQQYALIAIILILMISLVSGGIIFYQKLRNARTINQNILIEQKLLRSQMTPHFIFNSLAVLQGMILNKEERNSISYLSKFSKLLRTVLENSRHKTVSLEKELSAIKSYVDLQNLSVNPPFEFDLKIDPSIGGILFKIPPMLIQPFIENAVEHGFRNKKNDKRIELRLDFVDQRLECKISDNGVGLNLEPREPRKDKKSLATTITSERLAMLSNYFEVQGTVKVEDRALFGEQGTLVTLVIPYKIEAE